MAGKKLGELPVLTDVSGSEMYLVKGSGDYRAVVGVMATKGDAPNNGEDHIRKDGEWVVPDYGVTSFNTRVGDVSPQVGDYTTDEITEGVLKFVTSEEKTLWNSKQESLVSGTNIKTINGQSLLGSGDMVLDVGGTVKSVNEVLPDVNGDVNLLKTNIVGLENVDNTSDLNKPISTATQAALNTKQDTLVSGTNIKRINGQSILGSGNVDIGAVSQSNYTVVTVNNGLANQAFAYTTNEQSSYAHDAFSLKEEPGATGQIITLETFDSTSAQNYTQTPDVFWMTSLYPFTGETYTPTQTGDWFASTIKADAKKLRIQIPQPASMLMNYSFDNNVTDATANTTFTLSGTTSYVTGQYGNGLQFAGGYGTINYNNLGNTASFSISCWVKINASQTNNYILSSTAGASNQNIFLRMLSDKISVSTTVGGTKSISGTTTIVPGQWYHACVTFNINGDINLYVNGILEASSTGFAFGAFGVINVGRYVGGTAQNFNGAIDELKIFNNVLAQQDVNTLYTSNTMNSSSIKALLKSGTTYYTSSNGTLTPVTPPSTVADIVSSGFIDTGLITVETLVDKQPLEVVVSTSRQFTTEYTPKDQIVVQQTQFPLGSFSKINSSTIETTKSGSGLVRIVVSTDGIDWKTWNGSSWVSLGTLTNDTTSAELVVTSGIPDTTFNTLTWTQWGQLFSQEIPSKLSLAYAISINNEETDIVSIEAVNLNVDYNSSWLLQTAAQVQVRWYKDQVVFKPTINGNFKFAYQAPPEVS